MTDEQRLVMGLLETFVVRGSERFECEHPNVFGCPNHGELARALVRPLPRVMRRGYEQLGFMLCPPEYWPIAFTVTERGKCLNAGREFQGEAWE